MPAVTFNRYFFICDCSKSSPDDADISDLEVLLERRFPVVGDRLGLLALDLDRLRDRVSNRAAAIVCIESCIWLYGDEKLLDCSKFRNFRMKHKLL